MSIFKSAIGLVFRLQLDYVLMFVIAVGGDCGAAIAIRRRSVCSSRTPAVSHAPRPEIATAKCLHAGIVGIVDPGAKLRRLWLRLSPIAPKAKCIARPSDDFPYGEYHAEVLK
ncbi:MAG: hypothetical protein JOZ80_14935 [Acidobacteriaceae bacterium]|nr:hypothetical protein [Acidobacteriaceae bacterium]